MVSCFYWVVRPVPTACWGLGPAPRDSDSFGRAAAAAGGASRLFPPASQRQLRGGTGHPLPPAVITVPSPSFRRDAATRVPVAPAAAIPSPGPCGAEVLTLLAASVPMSPPITEREQRLWTAQGPLACRSVMNTKRDGAFLQNARVPAVPMTGGARRLWLPRRLPPQPSPRRLLDK